MKCYSIRGWNEHFENNRSRTVKDLAWVAIPNRHDGEHFSTIMNSEHGAEIFSAWVLMLQVASRCQPRGTLLRDNKKPHSASSLSVKTRAPENWFILAFEFLEKHTDWLEIKELQTSCQSGVSALPEDCHPPDEEGKGKKGREGTGAPAHFQEVETPSWKEFWAYCQTQECLLPAEWYAKENWKGKPNWKAYARRCKGWWESDGRPKAPSTKGGKPPVSENVGGRF